MTQTHKLVSIEPTALQVRAGQLGVTTTCAEAIYAAMLASAPEVGEAVAKFTRQSDGGLMLTDDKGRYLPVEAYEGKLFYTTPQPSLTAQLEAERDSYKSALEAALEEKAQAKHDETVAVKLQLIS